MNGMSQVDCPHPTCLRSVQNTDFFTHTKKSVFYRRDDFNRIILRKNAENLPNHLVPVNPHKKNTDVWQSFNGFQESCTLIAASKWPSRKIFSKGEIDIQFFLYARRVRGNYNALGDEYEYSIVLDVEEAAVFKPN